MSQTVFLDPLDVLFLRGNKLFGDPGSFGESLVPPWPSAAAGALRSRLLADAGIDLAAFARGEVSHPQLGTPQRPGTFTVTAFQLARRFADGRVEALHAPPADLVIVDGQEKAGKPTVTVRNLAPTRLAQGLASSAPLPLVPVLAESQRQKPASGYWLTEAGWRKYLAGHIPEADELVRSSDLWALDLRVGVGLDEATRSAAEGRLFSVQAVALRQRHHPDPRGAAFDTGFLATVAGATLPQTGPVRLGGDGRAAAITGADWQAPEPYYDDIVRARRCRLVLTTPGIFGSPLPPGEGPGVRAGWLPIGADASQRREDGAIRFDLHGVAGWIVSAAVPRFEVVSGWDLSQWQPKPAQRAAPTGSVWWLELDEGMTAEALRKLVERGLWQERDYDANPRRAEGFNRVAIARGT
ncbi:type III-B CRISPR module-associated Cmr3 family protein [Sulfuricystis multivorans]|uniref:type III-B CRISPR module-associated Cmr3 family protein n=1 Tax=Sulfuricystis multivorans TaxID=2211108 RepID=UPI000F83BBBC|nr:type III-B CRISPR module-associated Cmr3 family protein [Sulfuricystis multivorans]